MAEQFMDEARQIAAQCWCDAETSDRVMDPVLCEAVAKRIASRMDSAAMFARNADFYCDLLDKCAEELGPLKPQAFMSDDGGTHDTPLRLKIPGLVAELRLMAIRERVAE